MYIPILPVITGPSGVGKREVTRLLLEMDTTLSYCVSATTRAPRVEDKEGVTYYFVSEDEFQRRVDAGDFLEYAGYTTSRYGTLRSEVFGKPSGSIPLAEIEIEGYRQLRKLKELQGIIVGFFLVPPSMEALERRLRSRGDNVSPEEIEKRLRRAEEEMECSGEFDHIIFNGDGQQERAAKEILDYLALRRKFALAF